MKLNTLLIVPLVPCAGILSFCIATAIINLAGAYGFTLKDLSDQPTLSLSSSTLEVDSGLAYASWLQEDGALLGTSSAFSGQIKGEEVALDAKYTAIAVYFAETLAPGETLKHTFVSIPEPLAIREIVAAGLCFGTNAKTKIKAS